MKIQRLAIALLGTAFSVSAFANNSVEPNLGGFHLEAQIGGANYQRDISYTNFNNPVIPGFPFSENHTVKNTNAVAGLNFGYDYVIKNLLLGISADINFTNVSYNGSVGTSSISSKINTFGSIKGLVGVKINPESYLYATSGIGYIKSSGQIEDLGSTWSLSKTIPAFVAGLGFNYTTPIGVYFNVGADYYIGRNYKVSSNTGDTANISTRIFVPYVGVGYKF